MQEDPCRPDSNFAKLESFLKVASTKERIHCTRTSSSAVFSKETLISNVAKLFLSDLIQEIKVAFEISDHLKGFTAFDPKKLSRSRDELVSSGEDLIEMLCQFYGQSYMISAHGGEYLPKVAGDG